MLLNGFDELGNDDVANVRQDWILDDQAAAADGRDRVTERAEGLSSGRRRTKHLPDGEFALIGYNGAARPGLQLYTSLFRGSLLSPSGSHRRLC